MANKKNTRRKYGYAPVEGSLAYDYASPELYPDYEYGQTLDIPAKPRVREKVVTKPDTVTRQSVSPFAIFGFAAAAVLLVFCLMARVQFTQAAAETQRLSTQLTELKTENSKLAIAYESALNLTEIEDYAINTLGMQKPQSDQIRYISSSSRSRAVVLDEGNTRTPAGDLIDSVREYFR